MNIGSIGAMPDFSQLRQALFQRADADGSGGVSLEEFEQLGKNDQAGRVARQNAPSAADMFAKLDGDGDGSVTQSEFDAAAPPPLQTLGGETLQGLIGMQAGQGLDPTQWFSVLEGGEEDESFGLSSQALASDASTEEAETALESAQRLALKLIAQIIDSYGVMTAEGDRATSSSIAGVTA
jgi:hypothetical protein